MSIDAHHIASTRFGLGPRPGELAQIKQVGAQRWLEQQLTQTGPQFDNGPLHALLSQPGRSDEPEARKARSKRARQEAQRQVQYRHQYALSSDAPLLERLSHFWTNHFAVSIDKRPVLMLAGAMERDAIRPHLTGRFSDMLSAVCRHPAMLLYLDNAQSAGPNSRVGMKRNKGLNENLAREILELHTLGVDGPYGQPDVEALAAMLTGWSVDRGTGGGFVFRPAMHQSGPQTLLGKRYPDTQEQQAQQALQALARHPATAQFLATKLARHFIADEPSAELVATLAKTYRDHDTSLKAMTIAMIRHPHSWRIERQKWRQPIQYLYGVGRAIGLDDGAQLERLARQLAQPTYQPGSPAGWPDTAQAWRSASALASRAEVAQLAAKRSDHSAEQLAASLGIEPRWPDSPLSATDQRYLLLMHPQLLEV
ncbi:DUF1800 domain-containing protein [Ferrimonas pelagia]|uniref:DUF1800 domain-containing protein n=1 Tax=Ferrimonas pelagia TaxID=1177826 RepID=A0ABP9EIB1_9GAMM